MPNIEQLRDSDPDLQGLDDDQVVDVVHQAYYPDLPREEVASALGVKPPPPPEEKTSLTRRVGDAAISLGRGIIEVPEAAVGLADIATGGRVGKALEEGVGIPGTDATLRFDPKTAKEMLSEGYSPAQKKAQQNFDAAGQDETGFMAQAWEKTKALVKNPSVAAQSVIESIPSIGAGGVIGRAFMGAITTVAPGVAAQMAAARAAPFAASAGARALADGLPAAAGAIGEGVVGAGQAAEQFRQANKSGLLEDGQAPLAAASGAADTLFAMIGGKVAKRLGIEDVDTLVVGAAANPKAEKHVARQILEGFISEGALEELPQSMAEQVAQNMAMGDPIDKDVPSQAVMGFFTGGLMGAGANAWQRAFHDKPAPSPAPEAPAATPSSPPAGPAPAPAGMPDAPAAVLKAPTVDDAIDTALAASGVPAAAAAAVGITKPAAATPVADEDPFSSPIPKPQGVPSEANPPVAGGASSAQPAAPVPGPAIQPAGMVGPAPDPAGAGEQLSGLVPDGGAAGAAPAAAAEVPAAGAGGAVGSAAGQSVVADAASARPGRHDGAGSGDGRGMVPALDDAGRTADGSNPVRQDAVPADTGLAAAGRLTPEALALKLARAVNAVAEAQAKLKAQDTDANRLYLADAKDVENAVRTQMSAAREQDAATWERYDAQQRAVEQLDVGSRVQTPDGPGTVLRKFARSWHVDVDGVGRRTLPPGALIPITPKEQPHAAAASSRAEPAGQPVQAPAAAEAAPDRGAAPASAPVQPDARADGEAGAGAVRAGGAPAADVGSDAAARWDAMSPDERRALLSQTAARGKALERNAQRTWAQLDPGWHKTLERLMAAHLKEKTDDATANEAPAVRDMGSDEAALQQPQLQGVPVVRRPGDQGVPGVVRELPAVPGGHGRSADAEARTGTQGQQPGVPAGQRGVGDAARADEQRAQQRDPDAQRQDANPDRVGDRTGTASTAPILASPSRPAGGSSAGSERASEGNAAGAADNGRGNGQRAWVAATNRTGSGDDQGSAGTRMASGKGAENTIFTAEAAERARARLKAKLGRLGSGIDPEMMLDGITLAGFHIEAGARKFAAYAKAMLADLGEEARGYLKGWYLAVRYDPRASAFAGEMSSASFVDEFDLDAIAPQKPAEPEQNGAQDGTATRDLDRAGPAESAGQPAADLRAPAGERDAGGVADGRGERAEPGNAGAAAAGDELGRGLGAGEPSAVPGERAQRRGDAGERGLQGTARADSRDERADDAGREGAVAPNPAPNALPVAPPQITPQQLQDFTIGDDLALGEGGQKTKFRANIAAIRLAKELRDNPERAVTEEDQRTLAKYVGWGGLPQAFDANNPDWRREYDELKELLTPEEFEDARRSTRYAHYTSREIIQDGVYAALRHFGFTGGRVLEPGAGVGNFIGLMPPEMRTAGRITAIEREPIAVTIAKHLYPQQNVQEADFTQFVGNDGYFDAVVGNPPFASDTQVDQSRRKHLSGLNLHSYFFAKSVDMMRDGGVLAQVVTNYFLDTSADKARRYIADRTKFLGAIRLPNNAFSKNAGTEVTTDIIFLQKRPESEWGSKLARDESKAWMDVRPYQGESGGAVPLNVYFHEHPEMMLGKFGGYGTMYRKGSPALIARDGQDTLALLKDAVAKLPAGVYKSIAETGSAEAVDRAVVALEKPPVQEGGYFVQDGKVMQRLQDLAGEARGVELTADTQWTEKTKLGERRLEQIRQLASMRQTLRDLLAAELKGDARMEALRKTLNQQYDAYRKEHGLLGDRSTYQVFDDDPDFPLLLSLEHKYTAGIGPADAKKLGIKPTKSTAEKAPIFTRRVVEAREQVRKVDTPKDALAVSMAERGRLDTAYIGELLGKDPEEVLQEMTQGDEPLLFMDPATNEYVLRDAYLSGNVRAKLAQAKAAAMTVNVRELEKVQPEDVPAHQIAARIGAPWVPTEVYENFAKELFGEGTKASIAYQQLNSSYGVYITPGSEVNASNKWGIPAYSGPELLSALLNNRTIKVTYKDTEGKTHTDVEKTEMANQKAQEIKDRFSDWLMADPDRAELLTRAYNDTNNNYVTRAYDGSWMTFPGKVPDSVIKFRRHQRNAIARIVQDRTVLLDHVVGAGKTFTIVAGAMELKRTGLANKSLVAVPNHLVKQWAADFYRLYPGANILTATKKDFERVNRRRFLAKIATGDWDAVVIAHSSFGFIQPGADFEAAFNQKQIDLIAAAIQEVEDSDADKTQKKRTVKQLEGMMERLEKRIQRLRDKPMDDLLDFNELGVDQLFVDEAHLFKNLMYQTKLQNVAGLGDPAGSKRAYDMYVKTQEVMEKNGRGQGLVFATGTPVSNSLAEKYHMMRYLMPQQMEELGFQSFDAWANTYADVRQHWMQKVSGDGFKAQNRMSEFVNVHELLKLFDQVADTVTNDDIKKAYREENNGAEYPLPPIKGGKPRAPVSLDKSPRQEAYMEELARRAAIVEARKGPPQKGEDNQLSLMTDARKAAMDIRLVDMDVTEREKGGRIDKSAENIAQRYKQWDRVKGTQLVFSDLGTPKKHAEKELKEYQRLQAIIAEASDEVRDRAAPGDERAQEIVNAAEDAEKELDAQGPDWITAVKSALRGFSVYDDLKDALVERGIPEAQIAFIHDYNTDDQKAALFRKVNAGDIRVLIGSTAKMGAGTNVQERLVALHHLDVPWRPSDVEQREGRIVRQGNVLLTQVPGFEVEVLAYVTKDTLDMRMWQIQEVKLKIINQLRTRQIERNIDNAFEDMEMSASEMQAAATGNMDLLYEIQARNDIKKLENKRRSFEAQKNDLIGRKRKTEAELKRLPEEIAAEERLKVAGDQYRSDLAAQAEAFKVTIDGKEYTDWREASAYLLAKTDAKQYTRTVEKDGKKIREEMTAGEHAALVDKLAALRKEGKTDDDKEVAALATELTSWTERAAPLDITMNGEQYTARAKLAEAFSNLRGDRTPIAWTLDGTTYNRSAAAATAVRQMVTDALADEKEATIGKLGPFTVTVEGQPKDKFGNKALDIVITGNGEKIDGYITADEEATKNTLEIAQRVVDFANRKASSAGDSLSFLKSCLEAVKKQQADLDAADAMGEWPEQGKLEEARKKHAEILKRLAGAKKIGDKPAMYQGEGAATGRKVGELQQAVDAIVEEWGRTLPVTVVSSVTSPAVPAAVRAEAADRLRRGGGVPSGTIYDGHVWLFADRLDEQKAATVLYHEVLGHYGMRGVFGREFDKHLETVATLRREDVRRMIEKTGMDPADPQSRLRAAEEVLAHLAETQPQLSLVQRALALIRTWLRRLPGSSGLQLSDAELIRDYILPARRFVEGSSGPNGGNRRAVPKYSGGEGAEGDAERGAGGLEGAAVRDHAYGSLEVEGQRVVLARMLSALHDDKIRRLVVQLVPVHVMHDFLGKKVTPEALLRDKSVFEDVASVGEREHSIAGPGDPASALALTVAFVRAVQERRPAERPLALALDPAVRAFKRDLAAAMSPEAGVAAERDAAWANVVRAALEADAAVGTGEGEVADAHDAAPEKGAAIVGVAPLFSQAQGFTTREIQVDGKWRPIDNSNGQMIAGHDLAAQQAFWRWFGDSKVVDAEGRPLVVYHGTAADFEAFDPSRTGESSDMGFYGPGAYFTNDPKAASRYAKKATWTSAEDRAEGGRVIPVYLALKKPYITDQEVLEDAELERIKAEGYDGIISEFAKADGYVEYVAFRPEQIKSAISNRGTFDAGSPNIAFSQDAGLNNPRDFWTLSKEAVAEMAEGTPGRLHWWHKTLGTQYNLAKRSPLFKRVFDHVQDFLEDVSLYATEAADKAPSILPKLDTWRDIMPKALGGSGKKPLSAADNKAIRAPIFEGTLEWTRDAFGNPIRIDDMKARAKLMTADEKAQQMVKNNQLSPNVLAMWRGLPHEQFDAMVNSRFENTALKAGVVWTSTELRNLFDLTDSQIGLYREFRSSVDESITRAALADMIRLVGKDADFIRDEVMQATSVKEGMDMLAAQLDQLAKDHPDRSSSLTKTKDQLEDKARRALELMDKGYAPLMRFGHYTVTVYGPNEDTGEEEVKHFGMYESPLQARLAQKALAEEFGSEATRIERGTMNEESYKLFAGINPETVELFGEMLGMSSTGDSATDQAFQAYLKLARNNRSAMKRLIHRKGTAGFSEDVGRVLAGFTYSTARMTSRNLHTGQIAEAVRDIQLKEKNSGELARQATRLMEYVNNPGEEAQALRGLLFAQYLGGSIASALVNMTQPFQVTMPYLSQYGGIGKSVSRMRWALANAWKENTGDAALDAAMKRAVEEGVVAPQEVHQLMAQARGVGGLSAGDGTATGNAIAKTMNFGRRLAAAWGMPFSTAELFNRRVTFAAAYRTAQEQGIANPFEFAKGAVIDTQFLYCVDEETEALTLDGWKRRDQLREGDVLIGVDEAGRAIETPLLYVHHFPGAQEAIEFTNATKFSMVLTAGHDALVQSYSSRDKKWQPIRKVKASKLGRHHNLLRAPLAQIERDGIGSRDFAALMGWIAAEGHYAKFRNCKTARNVRITQSNKHNPSYVAEIEGILQRLGGHYRRFDTKGGDMIVFTLRKPLSDRVIAAMPRKLLTWEMAAAMDAHEMRAVLDAFAKGDGTLMADGGWLIGQKQQQNLDVLQAMSMMLGGNASLYRGKAPESGRIGQLYLHTSTKRTAVRSLQQRHVTTDGVWCPETTAGTWIARRNGSVFVTGNSKGNRPEWARGALGATLMTFKQYSISYLELVQRMWMAGEPGSPERAAGRRAVLFAAGMILLMGGAGGFPFVEDVEDVIDGIMQRLGYNWQSKQKMRELLQEAFGKAFGGFLEQGVSGLPGAPIDVSGRLGMGNLIPGTGIFQKRKDHARDVMELAGPTGDLVSRAGKALDAAGNGEFMEAGRQGVPKAMRDFSKMLQMLASGQYQNDRGDKVIDTTTADAIFKGIGFQPNAVAEAQQGDSAAQSMVSLARMRESEIAAKWAKGLVERDQGLQQEARRELADWNEKNPATPIRIRFQDVLRRAHNMSLTRAQRIAKSAPKEVRQAAGRIMRTSSEE